MNLIDKLRTNFKSPVKYIEAIADFKVDISMLLKESEHLNPNNWIDANWQDKISLMHKFVWDDAINNMPYTKSICEELRNISPYNSIYYRYLKPNTCYNWHRDAMGTCLHIPLITNEGCKFVYEDAVFTMPANGSVYIVNNGIPHSFMNAGKTKRLHITLDIF